MEDILSKLTSVFKSISLKFKYVGTVPKFIVSIMLLIVFYLIYRFIYKSIEKANLSSERTIKFKKQVSFINKVLFLVFLIPIWVYESKDILTFLGLFSAGMAFAFKDLVSNFLGWVIINSHKPFKVGDRIKIDDNIGDVVEIDWFYTTIIEVTKTNKIYGQSTGRFVYIPNIKLITTEVINETGDFPFTWNEIEINITLKSNWEKTKEIMNKVADSILGDIEGDVKESLNIASKKHPIYYQNLSHTIYTSIAEGKITLTLRFMCKIRNSRNTEHKIIEEILKQIGKEKDIELV